MIKAFILFLISTIICSNNFSQNTLMEEELSKLFYNVNLNEKPDKIAEESGLTFIHTLSDAGLVQTHLYRTKIKDHPFIQVPLKEGRFDITYDRQNKKLGIFEMTLVLYLDDEYDQEDEYNRLVSLFEPYSSKTLIETIESQDYTTLSQVIMYQRFKDTNIPQVGFYFDQRTEGGFPLVITYKGSWKNN